MVVASLDFDGALEQHSPLEAQLQATLNLVPAYAWYALPNGALAFVNQRTADYLGLPKDHPLRFGIDVGAEWDSHLPLLHPDDHAEMRRAWSHCLRTGCPGEVSFRARNAEGGYRWFLSRVEPLRASDGTLLYWIGVTLDIDERKRAEEGAKESLAAHQENARLTENQFKEGVSLASQRDATEAQAMKAQAGLLEASLDYLLSSDELNRVLGSSAK